MALKVRDGAASARRFVQRAAAAQPDYIAGVKSSGDDWERATVAGKENWTQGVQQAAARDAFSKGVQKSGGAYFQERAVKLGGQRFAQGVQEGAENWIDGTAASRAALANANLTPRGPRGSSNNMLRASEVAQILNRVRVGSTA